MTPPYSWLFFDLDGTLFDYNRAENFALAQVFQTINLPYGLEYLEAYQRINLQLWSDFEKQLITPDVLQVRRFELLLDKLGLQGDPARMSAAYLAHLSTCSDLIDGAQEVLGVLVTRYRIAVVTNGLKDVQRSRLARSAIWDMISELIISEEVGAAKPSPDFFQAAFAQCGHPQKHEVLLIGDSLSSDIQGGVNYGLDTCWYNPAGEPRPGNLPITYEITRLQLLLDILR